MAPNRPLEFYLQSLKDKGTEQQENTEHREKARENVFWDVQPGVPNTNSRNFS